MSVKLKISECAYMYNMADMT